MKIRQSYHGTGGKGGYLYEVYDNKDNKLGYINSIPVKANTGDIVKINKSYYQINKCYDCPLPESEEYEVVWYELEDYEFKADFDLGNINKYFKCDLSTLEVGTKFHVQNGDWKGRIVDIDGVKNVCIGKGIDKRIIEINPNHYLWITIEEGDFK